MRVFGETPIAGLRVVRLELGNQTDATWSVLGIAIARSPRACLQAPFVSVFLRNASLSIHAISLLASSGDSMRPIRSAGTIAAC